MMIVDEPVLNRTAPFYEIIEMATKGIIAAASSRNGMMESNMPDLLDGQVGRRVSILRATGSIETSRVFDFNGHLYRSVTITEDGNDARTEEALHFSESLRLTPKQQQ